MKLVVCEQTGDSEHQLAGHPERPDRLAAVLEGINDLHLGDDVAIAPRRLASRTELERVHSPAYLDELAAFCDQGGGDLDPDTYATADSWIIAQYAAGAGLSAIEELERRGEGAAFVAVRPPGHHALADRALGFCLLNNVAVAAAALVARGERVLVVDWDVHHGNGTQGIFWDSPDVLYVSTHQWPLFPGTGRAREVGGRDALGHTVNIPLPAGATGDVLRQGLEQIAAPAVDGFAPTWVLVSAGFDAHRDDPLADLMLTGGDYADLARLVAGFTPTPGRLAFFLEGGYDLGALRTSVAAALDAVLDGDYDAETASHGGPGADFVTRALDERTTALATAQDVLSRRNEGL